MLVPIIMASEADKPHVDKIIEELDKLQVPHKEYMASAHKVPEKVLEIVQEYNKSEEAICYITVAGRSNGLSGVVAGSSVHPVIACPPFKDKADYLTNIHSSVQMPSETPAMTVIDPKNSALAAARILAIGDKDLQKRVINRLNQMKESF